MWLRYVSLNNRLFLVQAVLIIHTNSGRRGQGFHCRLSVCFSAWYLKNRCSYDRLTWHAVVPRWVLETHLFWDLAVKVMSHKISASVGLCTFVSVGFFRLSVVTHCFRLSGIQWRTDTLTRTQRAMRMMQRVMRNVMLHRRRMRSSDRRCCQQCHLEQLRLRRTVACSIVQKHAVFIFSYSLSVTYGLQCWLKFSDPNKLYQINCLCTW